ncbi:MAG: helix-turn-helix domain-containing protein [Geminicoccaceae bacterium]
MLLSFADFPSLSSALEVAKLPGTTSSRGVGRPPRPSNPAVAFATLAIFNHHGGNVSATARALDIHRSSVLVRIRKARKLTQERSAAQGCQK